MLFYGFAHRTVVSAHSRQRNADSRQESADRKSVPLIVDKKPPIEEKIVSQIDFASAECHLFNETVYKSSKIGNSSSKLVIS
jgi:hypothetical protein